jgi:hypothetical protein
MNAEEENRRLQSSGLVHFDRARDSKRWIGPAGEQAYYTGKIRVTPLMFVKPAPGLEIHSRDGEQYVLPKDFEGDWFKVVSPKGIPLIR